MIAEFRQKHGPPSYPPSPFLKIAEISDFPEYLVEISILVELAPKIDYEGLGWFGTFGTLEKQLNTPFLQIFRLRRASRSL